MRRAAASALVGLGVGLLYSVAIGAVWANGTFNYGRFPEGVWILLFTAILLTAAVVGYVLQLTARHATAAVVAATVLVAVFRVVGDDASEGSRLGIVLHFFALPIYLWLIVGWWVTIAVLLWAATEAALRLLGDQTRPLLTPRR